MFAFKSDDGFVPLKQLMWAKPQLYLELQEHQGYMYKGIRTNMLVL